MLTDGLLNKYRWTSPILDCQILDGSLANIPCQGRLQNLIRAESHEIIYPVQGRGARNHTLSSGMSPYSPYRGVPPPSPSFAVLVEITSLTEAYVKQICRKVNLKSTNLLRIYKLWSATVFLNKFCSVVSKLMLIFINGMWHLSLCPSYVVCCW